MWKRKTYQNEANENGKKQHGEASNGRNGLQ